MTEKIRRPANAWIIYRKTYAKSFDANVPMITVSKILGKRWKAEDELVKAHFHVLALKEKERHTIAHPGYVYRPGPPRKKGSMAKPNRATRGAELYPIMGGPVELGSWRDTSLSTTTTEVSVWQIEGCSPSSSYTTPPAEADNLNLGGVFYYANDFTDHNFGGADTFMPSPTPPTINLEGIRAGISPHTQGYYNYDHFHVLD